MVQSQVKVITNKHKSAWYVHQIIDFSVIFLGWGHAACRSPCWNIG